MTASELLAAYEEKYGIGGVKAWVESYVGRDAIKKITESITREGSICRTFRINPVIFMDTALNNLVVETYVSKYNREQMIQMLKLLCLGINGDYVGFAVHLCNECELSIEDLLAGWNKKNPDSDEIFLEEIVGEISMTS